MWNRPVLNKIKSVYKTSSIQRLDIKNVWVQYDIIFTLPINAQHLSTYSQTCALLFFFLLMWQSRRPAVDINNICLPMYYKCDINDCLNIHTAQRYICFPLQGCFNINDSVLATCHLMENINWVTILDRENALCSVMWQCYQ